MAVYSVLPSTDLKFSDVRDTLNAGGGNVTAIQSSFFSAQAKINPWSKYKPVRHTKIANLIDRDFMEVNWGYQLPSPLSFSKYAVALTGTGDEWEAWVKPEDNNENMEQGWRYLRPVKGSNWLRMGDFRGYKKDGAAFGVADCLRTVTQNTALTVTIKDSELVPTNFGDIGETHYGVAIVNADVAKFKTMEGVAADGENVIAFSKDEVQTLFGSHYGTYKLAIFCTKSTGQNISALNDNYLSTADLTELYPWPIKITELTYSYDTPLNYFMFSILGVVVGETSVTFSVYATNFTAESHTLADGGDMKVKLVVSHGGTVYLEQTNALSYTSKTVAPGSGSVLLKTFTINYDEMVDINPLQVDLTLTLPDSEGKTTIAATASGDNSDTAQV